MIQFNANKENSIKNLNTTANLSSQDVNVILFNMTKELLENFGDDEEILQRARSIVDELSI